MENESKVTSGQSVTADTYRRLARARRLIDECFHLPLDLDQISSEACLSRFHFLRLFRRTFKKTPHQYLTHRLRVGGADEHLFVTPLGKALCYKNVRKTFRRLVTSIGLDVVSGARRPHIHDLRHTFASLLLQQGEYVRAFDGDVDDARSRLPDERSRQTG